MLLCVALFGKEVGSALVVARVIKVGLDAQLVQGPAQEGGFRHHAANAKNRLGDEGNRPAGAGQVVAAVRCGLKEDSAEFS